MAYVNSFKRLALERHEKKTRVDFFMELASRRFGEVPGWAREKAEKASKKRLYHWAEVLPQKNNLEEVFASKA